MLVTVVCVQALILHPQRCQVNMLSSAGKSLLQHFGAVCTPLSVPAGLRFLLDFAVDGFLLGMNLLYRTCAGMPFACINNVAGADIGLTSIDD